MKQPFIRLLFLVLSCCILSCSKENGAPIQTEPTILARLTIGPSIEQEESPISRTNAALETGIYAINVFWKGTGITSYQPYASGLFDDVSNVEIGIIPGYQYRFDCTFLPSSELPYSENKRFGRPFSSTKKGLIDGEVSNKLKVSINPLVENDKFHQLIYEGATQIGADSISQQPVNQHRYYGYGIIDLRTSTSNPTTTIELKRAYYTLRFTTTKELKENDSIKIITKSTDPFYIVHSETSPSSSDQRMLTMKTISDTKAWGWEGKVSDKEPISISVYYRKTGAELWTPVLEDTDIMLSRNKNNIIKIVNIDSEAQGGGNISFEDGNIGGLPNEDNTIQTK